MHILGKNTKSGAIKRMFPTEGQSSGNHGNDVRCTERDAELAENEIEIDEDINDDEVIEIGDDGDDGDNGDDGGDDHDDDDVIDIDGDDDDEVIEIDGDDDDKGDCNAAAPSQYEGVEMHSLEEEEEDDDEDDEEGENDAKENNVEFHLPPPKKWQFRQPLKSAVANTSGGNVTARKRPRPVSIIPIEHARPGKSQSAPKEKRSAPRGRTDEVRPWGYPSDLSNEKHEILQSLIKYVIELGEEHSDIRALFDKWFLEYLGHNSGWCPCGEKDFRNHYHFPELSQGGGGPVANASRTGLERAASPVFENCSTPDTSTPHNIAEPEAAIAVASRKKRPSKKHDEEDFNSQSKTFRSPFIPGQTPKEKRSAPRGRKDEVRPWDDPSDLSTKKQAILQSLIEHIKELGVEQSDIRGLFDEWFLVRVEELNQNSGRCPCGKKGLRYHYHIENRKNHSRTHVGSHCIRHFQKRSEGEGPIVNASRTGLESAARPDPVFENYISAPDFATPRNIQEPEAPIAARNNKRSTPTTKVREQGKRIRLFLF